MKPRILFFMHLVQDLDLLEPLILKAAEGGECTPVVCLTDRLHRRSSRVRSFFAFARIDRRIVPYVAAFFGLAPSLKGFDALVTAAESSARPHRVAHVLTHRANRLGLCTYTLQQGFENIGLTYFKGKVAHENVTFASKKIFIWGPMRSLHAQVSVEVRSRCVPVGCTKRILPDTPILKRPEACVRLVSVFENLHRELYSRDYRESFLADIAKATNDFSQVTFFVKPHVTSREFIGQWRQLAARTSNVILADPADPQWEPFTAPDILAISDAVITTPSTVALDAARAGLPAALWDYGLGLTQYDPLPRLMSFQGLGDFLNSLDRPADRDALARMAAAFAEKVVVRGDAVGNALRLITSP